jgi:hypothetical protein
MNQFTIDALVAHEQYKVGYGLGDQGKAPPAGLNQIMPEPKEVVIDLDDHIKTIETLRKLFPQSKEERFGLCLFGYDGKLPSLEEMRDYTDLVMGSTLSASLFRMKRGTERTLKLASSIDSDEMLDQMIAKASFRHGYINGISHHTEQLGMEGVGEVFEKGKVDLCNDYHLKSFTQGLSLLAPSIWMPGIEELGERTITPDKTSYMVGFAIALADKGVRVEGITVPFDEQSYNAFFKGRSAVPVKTIDGLTAVSIQDVADMPNDMDMYYRLGLRLWVVEQGLDGKINPDDLRHPESLYAFKTALSGKVMGDYDSDSPSPQRVARMLGQDAYDRGRTFHELKAVTRIDIPKGEIISERIKQLEIPEEIKPLRINYLKNQKN